MTEALGCPAIADVDVRGFGGPVLSMPLVRLFDFRVGGLPAVSQLVGSADLAQFNSVFDQGTDRELAGILGADFLFRTGGVIDFDRCTLRLTDPMLLAGRRFQGTWRSTAVSRNGFTGSAAATLVVSGDRYALAYDQHSGARAYTGRLKLDHRSAVGRFFGGVHEILDPPVRPRMVRLGPIEAPGYPDELLSFEGMYEFAPGKLTLLVPSDLKAGRPPLPKMLISPVNGWLDRIKFERVQPPALAAWWQWLVSAVGRWFGVAANR